MFPIRDTIPSRGVPVVTWGLILCNALVFLFELTLSKEQLQEFFYTFGLVPAEYSQVNWTNPADLLQTDFWPFLTMMFIHGGWLHILGNMWMLFIFGDNVEDRMGPGRFLIFYLLCGVAAAAAQFASSPHSPVPSLGASGAIAGVMGAYLVLYPHARIITLIPILFFPFIVEIPAFLYLGYWYLLQLVHGAVAIRTDVAYGGIAWWAHVGGFTAGILLLPLFLRPHREYRQPYPDEYQPW
jgi:membrane associated rhomboid family serine protease